MNGRVEQDGAGTVSGPFEERRGEMGRVTHLRHVGMALPDFDAAVDFYRGAWGLEVMETDTGLAFLAAAGSPEHFVYRLRRADDGERRLDLIAFGAEDEAAVDALAVELATAGVQIVAEPGALETPGGGYGCRFFDPDGRVIEVSCDVAPRSHRAVEPREAIPVDLSHVVLNTTRKEAVEAFYRERLGFELSDWLVGGFMSFWRCNAAHHSLAVISMPFASINHVAFEMGSIDDMMRGSGRIIADQRARPMWGPGRHSAGDNTFYYFFDPAGNVSEYTAELERVPPDWTAREHPTPDVWQVTPIPDFSQSSSADTPPEQVPGDDPGLWKAPPV